MLKIVEHRSARMSTFFIPQHNLRFDRVHNQKAHHQSRTRGNLLPNSRHLGSHEQRLRNPFVQIARGWKDDDQQPADATTGSPPPTYFFSQLIEFCFRLISAESRWSGLNFGTLPPWAPRWLRETLKGSTCGISTTSLSTRFPLTRSCRLRQKTVRISVTEVLVCWCSFVAERNGRYAKWKMAVQRSLGWVTSHPSDAMTGECFTSKLFCSYL